MDTINVDTLKGQLPDDWTEILKGLQEDGFWGQVTIELARPNLGNKLSEYIKQKDLNNHPVMRGLLREIEVNHHNYIDLFNPSKMEILWNNIKIKSYIDHLGQTVNYASKGGFLCRLKDSPYEYGFFDAKRGSCGFNRCSAGNSFATFYLGSWQDIYTFSLTDHYRKIIDEQYFSPKEKIF